MPHAQPSVDREWEGVTVPAHRKRVGSRRGLLVMIGTLAGLVGFAFFLYGVVFARIWPYATHPGERPFMTRSTLVVLGLGVLCSIPREPSLVPGDAPRGYISSVHH